MMNDSKLKRKYIRVASLPRCRRPTSSPPRFVRPFTVLFVRHHSATFTCCPAVKEAELKAEKKFQERLEKLLSSSGIMLPAPATADAAVATVVVEEGTPFQKRNAYILSAAEAGKSRWGSMEIERALGQANKPAAPAAVPASAPPPASTSTAFDRRNAHVVASAGVGKSRWGAMEVERATKMSSAAPPPPPAAAVVEEAGRISLEDRLNLGARLLGTAVAPPAPASTLTAFDRRNALVVASAGVGKSRWGAMEVERATRNGSAASASAIVFEAPPEVAAEEKRAASWEDRVNLGARLLGA